jgi:ABC-type bacteriocin/lantibiotic exporter with double-glycine peptidase domain
MLESVASYFSNLFFAIFSEILFFLLSVSVLCWLDFQLFIVVVISGLLILFINFSHQYIINSKYNILLKKQLEYSRINIDMVFLNETLKKPKFQKMMFGKQIYHMEEYKRNNFVI